MKSLSLATIFAALAGFAIIFIAPHAMPRGEVEEFMAFWGLFFAVTGLIDGLMQETTRSVSAARQRPTREQSANPWRTASGLAIILGALALVSSPLWTMLLTQHMSLAVALLAIGLVSYVFQALLSGLLSGSEKWPAFALLLTLDSGIRLVLVLVAWWAGWGLPAFLVVTVIGALSWSLVLFMAKDVLRAATDCAQDVFRRNTFSAMLATGATALLITGFPTFIKATQDPTPVGGVTMAAVMYAVTLTRAPILVPLQRFQSALIVNFVTNRNAILGTLMKPVAAVFGLGVVGAALAWLLGPWIMESLWGSDYAVPGLVLALLTIASACTGALMITGTATLAIEQHRAYVLGWVVASAVAFGMLLLPFTLATNVCAALLFGPLAGSVVHVLALVRD
ncbi:hypothetical protein CKALI_10690 [Corynebacterium kalinowskii]|uniref:Polysaccharide biosynthesis protein n=1 Tax=Corynebacterium kalinowskii TaxID=2675216 RepID=A0A6B8VIY4_9CORY|nr:hypothetical protein [Corynebacterium kalinowskii]QGU02989.1 hypothetical protein CKALI_10690 [Corynebacterium kalinowskii]